MTFACATLIAPTLDRIAGELREATGIEATVLPIENTFFGPRVNVSGLLTGQDFRRALSNAHLGDLAILPRYALDYTGGRFLDDMTPDDLQQALGVPLAFASTMREVVDILREPLDSAQSSGAQRAAVTNGKSWVDYGQVIPLEQLEVAT